MYAYNYLIVSYNVLKTQRMVTLDSYMFNVFFRDLQYKNVLMSIKNILFYSKHYMFWIYYSSFIFLAI